MVGLERFPFRVGQAWEGHSLILAKRFGSLRVCQGDSHDLCTVTPDFPVGKPQLAELPAAEDSA